MAHNEGIYRFCFSNHSPYPEFVDVNVHSSLFYNHVEHAKHGEILTCYATLHVGCPTLVKVASKEIFYFADQFIPIMDQIAKLRDKLVNIQFKQHWLMAEADRHEISKISNSCTLNKIDLHDLFNFQFICVDLQ